MRNLALVISVVALLGSLRAQAGAPEAVCTYNGTVVGEVVTLTVIDEGYAKNMIYQNNRTGEVVRSEILSESVFGTTHSYSGDLTAPPFPANTKFELSLRTDRSKIGTFTITSRRRTWSKTVVCK